MKLKLTITCDNAAFEDNAGGQCASILNDLAALITDRDLLPGETFTLRDFNGNRVGEAKVTR